jgi:hypothetical protein
MKISQISVFVENKRGRLYDVTHALSENHVNIRALSLAETSDFGVLRLIVDKPDLAHKVLKSLHFTVGVTDVVAIEVPDVVGGLAGVLHIMDDSNINVEYMYAFVEKSSGNAALIFRFDEIDRILPIMIKKGLKVLSASDIALF